jgi:H+-transporting ATPase
MEQPIDPPAGLTADEARRRLEKSGPNAVADTGMHPLRRALDQVLGAGSMDARSGHRAGDWFSASMLRRPSSQLLLAFNAALGFLQEGRAQATLAALKSRLALNAVGQAR